MNLKYLFYRIKKDYLIKSDKLRAEYIKAKNIECPDFGNECEIAPNVSFGSEPYLIKMGNNVKVTFRCQFITHDGGLYVLRNNGRAPKSYKYSKINIGNNVFMGREAIIMPGVNVGNNCVIGARALVTKDVPDNSVVAGIPAKVICTVDDYYNKNKEFFVDTSNMNKKEKEIYLKKIFSIK